MIYDKNLSALDRYKIPNREPNYLPLQDLIGEAYQNLSSPSPAIQFNEFPLLSGITGGFRPREFSILCGSTGVGKTTFIAGLSASMIRQQIPHYVASVETGAQDYVRRILSVFAEKDLNTGDAIPREYLYSLHKRFRVELTTSSLQLALYENRTTVDELMSDILNAYEKHGSKIAIIDNLNFFLEITRAQDSIIEMDRVIHELVIFCKQVDIHVIMIMHPKKTSDPRDTRVESEYEIRGSSLAVQEAHNVFLLNRPKKDDVENGTHSKFDRELKIAKMRRFGKAVGKKIFFSTDNGVSYREKACED